MIAYTQSSCDQTVDALKTIYRAVGLLGEGAELETVLTTDVDDAEAVSGDLAYAAAAADGFRTDCLPSHHVLSNLRLKDFV